MCVPILASILFLSVLLQGCNPGAKKPGRTAGELRRNPRDGAEMVWVPAGGFIMGIAGEQWRRDAIASLSMTGSVEFKLIPTGDCETSRDHWVTARVKGQARPAKLLLAAGSIMDFPGTRLIRGDICADSGAASRTAVLAAGMLFDHERPQHRVYLDGYWIYKQEVTVAQYRGFCKATGRKMPNKPSWGWRDDHPITNVTWEDAATYAEWAGMSLPTEAQWEKAARGTDGRTYPWGNVWEASRCATSAGRKLASPQPAGSHRLDCSPYGALDMSGNAREWCCDWYDPEYYENTPSENPPGPSQGWDIPVGQGSPDYPGQAQVEGVKDKTVTSHVLRGGCWSSGNCYHFRCCYRSFLANGRTDNCGFRCARIP